MADAWRDIREDLAAASADLWPDPAPGPDLLARLDRSMPTWHRDAACREHPELDWFAGRVGAQAAAKAVCAACLVRAECLDHALDAGEVGVWGGTTAEERRALRRAA